MPTARITELCLQLTAGSRPANRDAHRALGSQSCERVLLTMGGLPLPLITIILCAGDALVVDCQNAFALITKRIGDKEKMYAFCIIEQFASDTDKEDFLTCLSKAICSNMCRTDYVSYVLLTSRAC